MFVCRPECMCTTCIQEPFERRKMALDPLELEL